MALCGLGMSYQLNDRHSLPLCAFQKAYASSRGEKAAVMSMGVTHALAGRKKPAGKELAKLHEFARQTTSPLRTRRLSMSPRAI